ncbi:MAG: hypothetical protein U9O56_08710 [Campylobacterota bacterium]|nr:hypothetical protein [Campylobacterota bacterium]
MKQKGIALLITLFFISSISLIILKNLSDSEQFIDQSSLNSSLTQLKLTKNNIEEEVLGLTSKYNDNIDELIEVASIGIPFEYGDINISIMLDNYFQNGCLLSKINTQEDLLNLCGETIVENISYSYDFIELLKKYNINNPIKNKKQLEFFLDEYINETKDDKIVLVKDSFNYEKFDYNESVSYIQCIYNINHQGLDANGEFIFKLGEEKTKYSQFILE